MKTVLSAIAGLIIGAGAILYLISSDEHAGEIIFPGMMLVNYGDGFIIEGSIIGEGENKPVNNFLRLECVREESFCDMISINQIGDNHVGSLVQDTLKVESWEGDVVRLTSLLTPSTYDGCNYFEIRVDLHTEQATYTRIPNADADGETCALLSSDVMQWRIGDSDWHQRLDERLEAQ